MYTGRCADMHMGIYVGMRADMYAELSGARVPTFAWAELTKLCKHVPPACAQACVAIGTAAPRPGIVWNIPEMQPKTFHSEYPRGAANHTRYGP